MPPVPCVRTQRLTETFTAKLTPEGALAVQRVRRGTTERVMTWKNSPAGACPAPAAARPEAGEVWRAGGAVQRARPRGLEPDRENQFNAWTVESGTLVDRPPAREPGKPAVHSGNLRTDQEFTDFNLTLEVDVPAGSNSGVYLRGVYEIQVADTYGKPLDPHNMGALYSRITPSVAAERKPGEWQTLAITLVDRHVTVVLNGITIIDNQPVLGVTGGALWSDDSRPGPDLPAGRSRRSQLPQSAAAAGGEVILGRFLHLDFFSTLSSP
jgi:hypothetical protein